MEPPSRPTASVCFWICTGAWWLRVPDDQQWVGRFVDHSVGHVPENALVPKAAARINREYGTPHFALSFVGGVTVVLVASGRTEVLAEVASFLHLIMYGLICFTLIVIRRRDPAWYDRAFESPGYPYVPVVGGVASFSLLLYMRPLSQILGVCLTLIAVAWYLFYARDIQLKNQL